ncbi:hypothetical protein P9743_00380, partial [Anoxybacillus geothermalis]|nr:hypothetical protein [Anoxybacillus geothermalis]
VSPQIMQEVLSFHGSLVELTFGLMVIWQNIIQEERLHRLPHISHPNKVETKDFLFSFSE